MNKSIAIMQPYIFPYIGYMNLVNASENFVFYDDVNFIKKGWINRNNILLDGCSHRFTLPLTSPSQNKLIKDIEVFNIKDFSESFIKKLDLSYGKAIYKKNVLDYVDKVLSANAPSISEVAALSIEYFFHYVGINKKFIRSSLEFPNTKNLNRVERLVAITKDLNSESYINAYGGDSLYTKEQFLKKGIGLKFVKPILIPYKQHNIELDDFCPNLSIIDLMMSLSIDEIRFHLESYELI